MPQPSAMLNRLDMETRAYHPAIDCKWLDLMASGVTREKYKAQLARTYGFEAPLESALAYTPNLVVPDRRERTRSGLIAQDLLALGVSASKVTALPQCREVNQFKNPAEALGWKYVVERPTQLHTAIKRNIVARVADSAHACAYLSACDGVAAARWQQLGMLLDEVADKHRAADAIIEAARTAFACMAAWYAAADHEEGA